MSMTPKNEQEHCWYDSDPALQKALTHLRSAHDRYQAQVALNIIKKLIIGVCWQPENLWAL